MSNSLLVGPTIQAIWNSVLNEFFGKYFGTDVFWQFLRHDLIQYLVVDATILADAFTCFIDYLKVDRDENDLKQQHLQAMIENLRRNPLWDEDEFDSVGLEI